MLEPITPVHLPDGRDVPVLVGSQVRTSFSREGTGQTNQKLITGAFVDYDDMIIRAIVTSAVPEPSTLAMLLIGFAALSGDIRSVKRRQEPILSNA